MIGELPQVDIALLISIEWHTYIGFDWYSSPFARWVPERNRLTYTEPEMGRLVDYFIIVCDLTRSVGEYEELIGFPFVFTLTVGLGVLVEITDKLVM